MFHWLCEKLGWVSTDEQIETLSYLVSQHIQITDALQRLSVESTLYQLDNLKLRLLFCETFGEDNAPQIGELRAKIAVLQEKVEHWGEEMAGKTCP